MSIQFPEGHRCYGCAEIVQEGWIAGRARLWCKPCIDIAVRLAPTGDEARLAQWMAQWRPVREERHED